MQLKEVKTASTLNKFSYLPHEIYEDYPNYVHPIQKEIEGIFDPSVNKKAQKGMYKRWILETKQGKIIGRIAAFIDIQSSRLEKQPTGGVGFFECIDNQTAANILFQVAEDFLKNKGMEAMDGPINFGNRSAWWGLLVKGFENIPTFRMNYNPPYYKKLFENYGFQVYFNQYSYDMGIGIPDRVFRITKRILANPDYDCRHVERSQIDKFSADFKTIYDQAWVKHGVDPIKKQEVSDFIKELRYFIDLDIIYFAYYKNQPISFFVVLPDINHILKYLKGNFNFWNKLKMFWYSRIKPVKKIYGLVFGTVPEFQAKGIEAALIVSIYNKVKTKRYNAFEMNWIGDFHKRMMTFANIFAERKVKTHSTYRKLFDPNKPFERHPDI